MGQQDYHSYEFGRFRLKVAERVLLREGELVPLTPKVFDILVTLVENGGQVVAKDDLMRRVWPNTFVEEGNLTQNISLLRKALGETPGGVQFIETVPRRGYRFVAETSEVWGDQVDDAQTGNGHKQATASSLETSTQQDELASNPNSNSQSSASKRTPLFALAAGVVVIGIIGLVNSIHRRLAVH
jgi:DNA-binding winged helix-turn-helix (wHTH) protein